MRLGVATVNITPQVPIAMGGYGARAGKAVGVHDPLTARALVLEDESVRTALVVADLLMLSRAKAEAVQAKAATLTGIPAGQIIVAATHTHSGPVVEAHPGIGGEADPAYAAWVEEALAGAVYQASLDAEEVWAAWGSGEVEGVGSGRRSAAGASDPQPLAVLSFCRPGGERKAVLVNYQSHPTVMGADNLLVSADLAGAGREVLQRVLGPDVFLAFVNGACGDISTRFTRRSQTFGELERLGGLLAVAAADVVLRLEPRALPAGSLKVGAEPVNLPLRALPSRDEAKAQLARMQNRWEAVRDDPRLSSAEKRVALTALEGAQVQAMLIEYGGRYDGQATLVGWRLGAAGLVTIPGELFSSLGGLIRRESGLAATLVTGYSGGHAGYIPDREAFRDGGYEAMSSPLAAEAGEVLAGAAVGLLRRLA